MNTARRWPIRKIRIAVTTLLLIAACCLTYYFHAELDMEVVFTHFFYLPIILAALWWGRKGLAVAVFLAVILIVSRHVFRTSPATVDDYLRAIMFIAIGFVVAELCERIASQQESLRKSEQNLAEEALRESEGRFRAVFDTAEDCIFIKDRTRKYVQVNPAMEKLFDLPASELIGRTDEELFGREADEHIRDADLQALAGEVAEVEDTKPVKGSLRTFHVVKVPMRDKTGEIVGICGIARDITERKRIEHKLRESEERFQQVTENAHEWIWEVDADGLYTYASSATEKSLGYKPGEVVGKKHFYDFFLPEDREKLKAAAFGVFAQKKTFREFINPCIRKDGETIWLSTSGAPILDGEGNLLGYRGADADITERKRLEEQFRQAQKMEAVGQLAGGIAHDFNNQLTVIKGYCDLLLGQLSQDDSSRTPVEEILTAGEQAAELTSQLLAFSRKHLLHPEVVNLNKLLAEMHNPLASLIGGDIELRIASGANLGNVRADLMQIEQAVINLVVNARDAMPDGGRLTIATSNVELDAKAARKHHDAAPGSYVMLSVTDTGKGMDEKVLQKIFEPFFTTKETGEGTGLGLSMVYGFVKQSGGYIDAASEVGKGTTFRIYLPRVEAPLQ